MQKYHVAFAGISFAMMVIFIPPTFAQSDDVLDKGIYQEMKESKNKVDIATKEGATGSGVPIFAADGVLGASFLSAGVFGGIAATFFIRSRKGKYAAMGRG